MASTQNVPDSPTTPADDPVPGSSPPPPPPPNPDYNVHPWSPEDPSNQDPPPPSTVLPGPPPPPRKKPFTSSSSSCGCGACRKIGLVLWKNLLYRRRHYIITTLEILLPTILTLCLALLFNSRNPTDILNLNPSHVSGSDLSKYKDYQDQSSFRFRHARAAGEDPSSPKEPPKDGPPVIQCNRTLYADDPPDDDDFGYGYGTRGSFGYGNRGSFGYGNRGSFGYGNRDREFFRNYDYADDDDEDSDTKKRDSRCVVAYTPKDDPAINRVIERIHDPETYTGDIDKLPSWIIKRSENAIEDYVILGHDIRDWVERSVHAAVIFDQDLDKVIREKNHRPQKTFRYSLRSGNYQGGSPKSFSDSDIVAFQDAIEKSLSTEILGTSRRNKRATQSSSPQFEITDLSDEIEAYRATEKEKQSANPEPEVVPGGGGGVVEGQPQSLPGLGPVSVPKAETKKKTTTRKKNKDPASPAGALVKNLDPGNIEGRATYATIFVGMGFVFMVPSIMKGVVNERETGIKELMKLCGISNWIHWLSWTINFLSLFSITVTIVVLILFYVETAGKRFMWNCNGFLLWLILWLYVLASMTFIFFLSSFFPKPVHATTFGIIVWLVSVVGPAAAMVFRYQDFSTAEKMGMSIIPNAALFFIFRIVMDREKWDDSDKKAYVEIFLENPDDPPPPEIGLNWKNFYKPKDEDIGDQLTLLLVGVMLVVDIVLYFLLTLYLEAVLPSDYGLRKPFYFMFTPSFWNCRRKKVEKVKVGPIPVEDGLKPGFERDPEGPNVVVGVEIKNLRKIFGDSTAVDGVSLKMFHGEIFALLGHNGAGKTTTISCCIGMMAPSSGTAIINKFDIVREMARVREHLGVCPQHNLLFDELTVDQHLIFFGKLKRMGSAAAKQERMEMLTKLQLTPKASTLAKNLSGGQKRKLCLGIALIGNAKVVFLDEPTSGMDVEARRAIWDLLLGERQRRTIILTTHFMEEADILGDRIAIMAQGKVQCCGTSHFLKQYYGTGYTLTMTFTTRNPEVWASVLSTVQVVVPTAAFKEDDNSPTPNQLDISLPKESCSTATFSKLFKSLQEKKQSFGILTFGLSLTTLDEVFIKVDEAYSLKSGKAEMVPVPSVMPMPMHPSLQQLPDTDIAIPTSSGAVDDGPQDANQSEPTPKPRKSSHKQKSGVPISEDASHPSPSEDLSSSASVHLHEAPTPSTATLRSGKLQEDVEKYPPPQIGHNRGIGLVFEQFIAFLIKKCHYSRRKWKLFFCQVIIPTVLAFIAVACANAVLPSALTDPGKNRNVKRPQSYGFDEYPEYEDKTTYYYDRQYPASEFLRQNTNDDWEEVIGKSATRWPGKNKNFKAGLIKKYLASGNEKAFKLQYPVAIEVTEDGKVKAFYIDKANRWIAHNMATNLALRLSGVYVRLEMTEGPTLIPDSFQFSNNVTEILKEAPLAMLFNFPIFGLFIPIGLSLLAASFVVAPIEEKICKAKQLQLMTGASAAVYWGANFLWDFVLMLAVSVLILGAIMLCQKREAFTVHPGGAILFLILVVFAYAAIPFSYLFTLMAGSVAGGFGGVASIHVLFVLLGFASGSFMEGVKNVDILTGLATTFRVFGSIFPSFGLTMCLIKYVTMALRRSKCNFLPYFAETLLCSKYSHTSEVFTRKHLKITDDITQENVDFDKCCAKCGRDFLRESDCVKGRTYLEWSMKVTSTPLERDAVFGISQELLYLFLLGMVYHVMLLVWEVGIAPKLTEVKMGGGASMGGPGAVQQAQKENLHHHEQSRDEDVENEAQRVIHLVRERRAGEDALVVHNFSKTYGTFAAVKDVNFGLHYGECFGLLGVNGAGKTTTFRMLTGDETRSSGNAYASGKDLDKSRTRFLSKIGYCPQFDGIIEVLSGLEMVQLFGRLRGVKRVKQESKSWMARVGLTANENHMCGRYSGGMKRRLSAAMALIGDPEITLLDEPTSGVDPVSRKQFWKIILSTKAAGRAIILTSHSMDEITACCSRLAIMVNGQLQCLGGVHYLKNKFAQGFSLDLKIVLGPDSDEELASLDREIIEKLAPCQLKDRHASALQYHLQDPLASWDILFSKMEEIKDKYSTLIEDYSITETTLEQVFLAFARMQYPARTAEGACKCFG